MAPATSPLQESIEFEENSEYSLEFDDDDGWRGKPPDEAKTSPREQQQQQQAIAASAAVSTAEAPDEGTLPRRTCDVDPTSSPTAAADVEADTCTLQDAPVRSIPSHGALVTDNRTADNRLRSAGTVLGKDRGDSSDRRKEDTSPFSVQQCEGREDSKSKGMETLTTVTQEQEALRECLGVIQQELLEARHRATKKAASRSSAAQAKKARARAQRMRYLEQLGEARRARAGANAAAEALRAQLEDREKECRRTRETLEAARSAGKVAEERAEKLQKEVETSKDEIKRLRKSLTEVQRELEGERKQATIAVKNASDELQLSERKRELEVASARQAADARERAVEKTLQRLPEHQQLLLQAELDRVARWEERLAAESASLQRREEVHKIEVEACRAEANRVEAESRARAEKDTARERACLREAKSAFGEERGELLRRVAAAEAIGQAQAAEAAAMKAEAAGAIRRIEMDTSALDTRAELLAPKFQALGEGRTALDLARKEVREEARTANREACRAREMEAAVLEREAVVETRWQGIAAARRAVKQMEKDVAEEADTLAEQRKSVTLARLRLHEQQLETSLQISEIRKALDAMKRLDQLQDRGARRLALELGTLALDKGVRAARSNNPDSEADEPECTAGSQTKKTAGSNYASAGGSRTPESLTRTAGHVSRSRRNAEASHVQGCEEINGETGEDLQGAEGPMGRGVYAEEAATWEAIEEVRYLIAWPGEGACGSPGVTSCATKEGSLLGQVWAKRLHAAAPNTGAL